MQPYICLTYATENGAEADRLTDMLLAYGFRVRTLHEGSEPDGRLKILSGAALVLALTSQAAHDSETVAADLRRMPEKGHHPICLSIESNPIDERFCASSDLDRRNRLECIPYPVGDAPDPQAVGLLVHRLFICRLVRVADAFSPDRCRQDPIGQIITTAAAALNGDRNAAYALGCAYERGDVLPVLEHEAATWITHAADAGSLDARLHLGELYLSGWGVELDEKHAFSLFASVADAGDVRGEYRLALCYLNGAGVVSDPTRAVSHLRHAARWNYAPALYRLGLLSRDGVGTEPDARLALQCFYRSCRACASGTTVPSVAFPPPLVLYRAQIGRRATAVTMRHICHRLTASRGVRIRAFSVSRYKTTYRPERSWIGGLTRSDHITVPGGGEAVGHPVLNMNAIDVAMGVSFDPSNAALALAKLLETGDAKAHLRPHPTRALVWYRYALRQGNTEALYCLADAHGQGLGAPADPSFAAVLYRIAADWSDPRGQFSLGVAYERGLGVEPDVKEAVRRYEQAAIAGYPPAQNNLGGCYEHGVGVARNILTAVEWYVRAADAGLPEAMCRLGICYETGRGVPTDTAHAFDLYQKAAKDNHPYALYRLGICYDHREQSADAVRCWRSAADAGLPEAAYALAMCHAAGRGTRPDLEHALSYLYRAAKKNHLPAIYRLAICFLEGGGVARNTSRALTCLERAVSLWHTRKALYVSDTSPLPLCADAAVSAAGKALYMLGVCRIEGWDPTYHALSAQARAEQVYPLFAEAAELGHVGALVALGDLYAHGHLICDACAEDMARTYYERAVRVSAMRRGVASPIEEDHVLIRTLAELPLPLTSSSDMRTTGLLTSSADALSVDATPALVSLAVEAVACGKSLAADTAVSETYFDRAWRLYAAAVELGSADARIGMAECMYHGYGRPSDPLAALRLLQALEGSANERIAAYLWLGDLWRLGAACPASPVEADHAYRRALSVPVVDSEVGPYALSIRREQRAEQDTRARVALLYRLSTLRAVYPPCTSDGTPTPVEESAFSYLCETVLAGHPGAREDLARMYTYERRYSAAIKPEKGDVPTTRHRVCLRRRPAVAQNVLREHALWLSDYYTALWPEPIPFEYTLFSKAALSHIPSHITAIVTPAMTAEVLNYVGDCFFYGNDLPCRKAAAVSCYREAATTDLSLPRGEAAPEYVIWAQYSLGWCLLHGEGIDKNEREAVRYLTAASRTNPNACYTLGECYEKGVGVDNRDLPEALKCYRRAMKLGYPKLSRKIKKLEVLLDRMAAEE